MTTPADKNSEASAITPYGIEEARKFYEEWPGGIDEVESALNSHRRIVLEFADALPADHPLLKEYAHWLPVIRERFALPELQRTQIGHDQPRNGSADHAQNSAETVSASPFIMWPSLEVAKRDYTFEELWNLGRKELVRSAIGEQRK